MTSIPACAVPSGSAGTSEMAQGVGLEVGQGAVVHVVEVVVGREVGIEEGAVAIDRQLAQETAPKTPGENSLACIRAFQLD